MAKSETLSETPDAFEQAWKEYNSHGTAGGWEKVAFTKGFGAGFKAGMSAGRLQGLEEAAALIEPETKHSAYAAQLWAAIRGIK
jgi:hypothetical protein